MSTTPERPFRVQVKLRMIFKVNNLEETEKLLGAIKEITKPSVFNADVNRIEEREI